MLFGMAILRRLGSLFVSRSFAGVAEGFMSCGGYGSFSPAWPIVSIQEKVPPGYSICCKSGIPGAYFCCGDTIGLHNTKKRAKIVSERTIFLYRYNDAKDH